MVFSVMLQQHAYSSHLNRVELLLSVQWCSLSVYLAAGMSKVMMDCSARFGMACCCMLHAQ